jgi:hypothetical protein
MSTLRVNNITDASGGSSSLSVPGAAWDEQLLGASPYA